MKIHTALLALTLGHTTSARALDSPLPLRRVRLYETGVAYFERSGAFSGTGETALPIPRGHLDDALKTLVILGGDVQVSGVEFSSSVSRSMARKLAGLGENGEGLLKYGEVLKSFKGAAVRVSAGGEEFAGRIVDVLDPQHSELQRCAAPTGPVQPEQKSACVLRPEAALVLFGDRGEVRRLALTDVSSIRPTEPETLARMNAALDALSPRGAQSRGALRVLGSGGKSVSLGYVAEAPVWRSTYRLVLDAKDNRAKIQGWALLHNDTDEDWRKVQVELVNGRPDSFLFPLAAPRYAARRLVTPENELSTVPQLFDTTVDNMWSEGGGGRGQGIGLGGLGLVGHGEGGGGYGMGDVNMGDVSDLLSVGNLADLSAAQGVEAAALFRYTLPAAVDLRAHGSALVPFVSASVSVRRIAWFGLDGEAALSGIHLTNETQQTLPEGTIALFADAGFAGESALSRTKPGETRVIRYGLDLDIELSRDEDASEAQPKLFSFDGRALTEHFIRRRGTSFTIVNRSGSSRTVYVELDVVNNAKVSGAELGLDSETKHHYAMFEVGPRQELSRKLQIEEGLRTAHPREKLSSAQLRELAVTPGIPAAQRAKLETAAGHFYMAETRQGAIPKREAELEVALEDLPRLREHARVLGGIRAPEVQNMAQRIVLAEDRVSRLRRRLDELRAEAGEFQRKASAELQRL